MLSFSHESRFLRLLRGLAPRALILAAAAIALITVDQHGNSLAPVRSALMGVVYPTQWLVSAPSAGIHELSTMLASRSRLLTQNKRLKHDYLLAQMQLEQLEALRRENRRLRELLNAASTMRGRVAVTTVLSINTSPFANRITINMGAHQGVGKSLPLLDARGIIGQTLHVGALTSQVMLITDPSSAVPVVIKRTDTATIAVGTGSLNLLSLPYLPNSTHVKAGDILLTSGLGGVYPQGYPVGVITRVTPQPDQRFALVEARPLAKLGRENQVLLYFAKHRNRSGS